MKKEIFFRIITLVVLNAFIISFGLTTFGATREEYEIRWSTLATCSDLFYMYAELPDYDIIACGGETIVPSGYYAYVKVDLEYYINGSWENFASYEDEGYISANVERQVIVTPGYTYRLKTTHKAKDANGNVLETFNSEAENYVASLPRN